MKYLKKIVLAALIVVLGVTIGSCSKKTTRNTTTPYGNLNLSTTVASSSKDISLTLDQYYSRLRTKGYDLIIDKMKEIIYKNEVTAITNIIKSSSFAELSSADKKTLAFNSFSDIANSISNEITEARYNELKKNFTSSLSNSIASSVYGSTDTYTVNSMTEEAKNTAIQKYIESAARVGNTITADNISWTDDNGTVKMDLSKIPADIMNPLILSQAENFYAQKKLYSIADQEYLYVGTDDEEKNTNYLFTETSIPSYYDTSYKTFGTYKAIIITFNSRREAMKAMEAISTDITSENAESSYLSLYNNYYKAYGTQDINSDQFSYTISDEENELSEISSSVNTLITETLEDGEFLTEPRNLNNKYVLAYRISTEYEYDEVDYEDLAEATKNELTAKIKNNIVSANVSSYITTAFQAALEEANIEIYDPLFEYRFYNSYTDYYDLIETSNASIGQDLIFKFNDESYSVEDFYTAATKRYGASVVTEYFQLEYAYLYADEYITTETTESNQTTLNDAVKAFNKGENASYPKEIGLETYLLAAYGYPTQDAVMKYYYQATSCISSYRAQVLFDEWATEDHKISTEAEKVLNRILAVGNANYSELFTINVDHILINIDYNADGSPDDPDKFMADYPEKAELFKSEIQALAQAIYKEATNEAYAENTLFETLSFIVKQFNKGNEALLSKPETTWDAYKNNFNFLLTAERLASSGDITQDSVSNFVVPFADYIRDMYKNASENEVSLDDNGNFFLAEDGKITTVEDAAKITSDSLCKTVYGYHLIVLNDYDGPDYLKFTADNDPNHYQQAIQVLISEDEDDSSNNVYVTLDSYNANTTEANLNQLFIYYVQSKTGADSSLDSSIVAMLSTLFTDAIAQYSSSNFQTMTLLDLLNITSNDSTISSLVKTERNYYANLVIDYDQESDYISWINPEMDWTRPNQK